MCKLCVTVCVPHPRTHGVYPCSADAAAAAVRGVGWRANGVAAAAGRARTLPRRRAAPRRAAAGDDRDARSDSEHLARSWEGARTAWFVSGVSW